MKVGIVGGGVFGLAAAWRLAVRGHAVSVLEADTIPAQKAASRDVSKALRAGYGACSATYAPAVGRARELWRELEAATGRSIYHETGCIQICSRFEPGGFEYDGYRELERLGWPVTWLEANEVERRFPAFAMDGLRGGAFDPNAGWVDPMEALPAFADAARAHGADIRERTPVEEVHALESDVRLVCAGAWLPRLVPDLGLAIRTTRQHEAMYRPAALGDLAALPAWSIDMATEGWYGFPPTADGLVKVARHVPDADDDPDGDRAPVADQAEAVRGFVEHHLPALTNAPDEGRSCFYTMSPDGSFLFDAVPGHEDLFAAGCGGGHAFKFGPMLGEWAADLVEGRPVPEAFRIRGKGRDRVV